ncbi:MAG: DeoR family transcriptional regulator [[Clostridium] innocuum]
MEKRLEKRLDEISNYLLSHGKASVKELSDCFGVTMETIRKDLEFLQRKGILFRTHGGAVLRNSFTDVPIDVRTQEKIEVKKAICMEVSTSFTMTMWFLLIQAPLHFRSVNCLAFGRIC